MPAQMPFATNELMPSTMFVPPRRFGPPESPKHVPDGFECSLRNCELSLSFEPISVVCPKKRVNASPSRGLQLPGHGPPPRMKFWSP